MSLSLVDELTKKQAPKFQVNEFDSDFIKNVLSEYSEGILNLDSKLVVLDSVGEDAAFTLEGYLIRHNKNYQFKSNNSGTNYEIMFKKKEAQN